MVHFGIICPTVPGHLNPMTTLGYELKQRGHRVTLVGIPDARSHAVAAGLEFKAIGETQFPEGTNQKNFVRLGELNGLAALRYTVSFLKQMTVNILQNAPAAIQETGIEALLVDRVSSAGGTVAEFLNLPFITVHSALILNQEENIPPFNTPWQYNPTTWARLRNKLGYSIVNRSTQPIRDVIARYRQTWNLPPRRDADSANSQLAQISQQPAEFEFPRQNLPDCFHFTGPFHNPLSRTPVPFPYEKLTGQPLIYASMGTLQNRLLWVFENIAQACDRLDVQLVISLGGGSNPEFLPKLPGNPIVVGYAPQLELLAKASLTITHAGLNTTLESLSKGVPMVAIPITNDQPGVASRIAWTGSGEAVPLAKSSPKRLREALERVLKEDSYKKNALRLQEAIGRSGGVKKAADIIEQSI
ncbi:glycosyltransferase [Candidatus Gracilibacteria bacterium]|nr:glycosyltransferase [Candidatus Gracilibacteria bacterium]NJM86621.1 glycosyltransferase [Hydrococcus sp. RU_2_2]NJP19308.1 glycosyltransferase [Hydrococcus sp. CRU_1_1]